MKKPSFNMNNTFNWLLISAGRKREQDFKPKCYENIYDLSRIGPGKSLN